VPDRTDELAETIRFALAPTYGPGGGRMIEGLAALDELLSTLSDQDSLPPSRERALTGREKSGSWSPSDALPPERLAAIRQSAEHAIRHRKSTNQAIGAITGKGLAELGDDALELLAALAAETARAETAERTTKYGEMAYYDMKARRDALAAQVKQLRAVLEEIESFPLSSYHQGAAQGLARAALAAVPLEPPTLSEPEEPHRGRVRGRPASGSPSAVPLEPSEERP
jgi:hypothetical protein